MRVNPPEPSPTTWLSRLLVLLAVGLAANSILGPLGLEIIDYRYSESLINQGIGLDAVALLAAVPLALTAARLVRHQHPAGSVLAFIPSTFTAYMAPQYIVGPEYLGLPGNNERFFLFHLALFLTAIAATILAWQTIDRPTLRPDTAAGDRHRSVVLFGVIAFIVFGRWLAGIIDLVGGNPASNDFRENPTAYLLIGLLDLGIVVPAALVTAVALRRHRPWARSAAYVVVGWFALVPAAVAAMAIVMEVNNDPNASTGTTVIFVAAATVFTIGAAWLYRPMFQRAKTDDGLGTAAAAERSGGRRRESLRTGSWPKVSITGSPRQEIRKTAAERLSLSGTDQCSDNR